MEFMKLRTAYNGAEYGRETLENILDMIRNMPDKKALFDGGNTLLHLASEMLHLSAVQYLLESGCDPNINNSSEKTPLMLVAGQKQLLLTRPAETAYKITMALLDAGANAAVKDKNGDLSYLVAAKAGNGEFIKALFDKGIRISRADERGNNGIHLLIESLYSHINNHRLAVERYKKSESAGASPETLEHYKHLVDEYGKKMDFYLNEAFVGVKALFDSGVDPDDKNSMGETAHVLAERRGAKKIGALLKGNLSDGGPNEELFAKAGGLTMVRAASGGDHEAIRALVGLGADVNALEDLYGYGERSPLAEACRNCDPGTARLLLELGADPGLKTGEGRTAITWLRGGKDPYSFSESHPSMIIDFMVASGMDINASVDDLSNTLLTWALRDSSDMETFSTRETLRWYVIKSAIGHNADVNKSNILGQTPVMLACAGNPSHGMRMADDIQILLLEKGAHAAAKDKDGNTPLIYAAGNSNAKAAKEMAENLFDFGDPQAGAVNNAGKSALDIAAEKNNDMLVKLLLSRM
ncbi:MAG: ankyrin repeat domain-containing protein [Methanomassiliicoccaceae archaeon]|nr:ankyrin repeat domain-containing protein [Methanomassiliicoccaceae archaeon]